MAASDMADAWARIPPRARSYVRHVVALPGSSSNPGSGSGSGVPGGMNRGVDVVLTGDARGALGLWVHEVAHSLDYYAVRGEGAEEEEEEVPFSGKSSSSSGCPRGREC